MLPAEKDGPGNAAGVLALEEKGLGFAVLEAEDLAVAADEELTLREETALALNIEKRLIISPILDGSTSVASWRFRGRQSLVQLVGAVEDRGATQSRVSKNVGRTFPG